MAEKKYFQWQNEFLMRSIYPLRDEKLRDFLVFCEEIDLWKKHRTMSAQVLEGKRRDYEAKQTRILSEMVQEYERQKKYFCEEDGIANYDATFGDLKDLEKRKYQILHATFKQYLHGFADNPWKEKVFIAQRVSAWEQYRREVMDSIFRQRRRVDMENASLEDAKKKGPVKLIDERRKALDEKEEELKRLEKGLLNKVDEELQRLNSLSSSSNKLEKRKMELRKGRERREAEWREKRTKISVLWWQIKKTEYELHILQNLIRRHHRSPVLNEAEKIVLAGIPWVDTTDGAAAKDGLITLFLGIRNELPKLIKAVDPSVRFVYMNQKLEALRFLKEEIDERIGRLENIFGPTDRDKVDEGQPGELQRFRILLLAVLTEMDKLGDYLFALEKVIPGRKGGRPADPVGENIKRQVDISQTLDTDRSQLSKLQSDLKSIEKTLKVDVNEELARYIPDADNPVDEKKIVMDMAEEYRASLVGMDQFELLEMIVRRFWDEPERYPLWLQYMVVHFSGMRYASAHGSWADPRELLLNLRTSLLKDEFRKLVKQEDIDAQCEAKKAYYEMLDMQVTVPGEDLPKLVMSLRAKDWERIKGLVEKLDSPNLYERLAALRNLRQEEDRYEVEMMNKAEVLEALKDLKEEADLPDWMWNEIVRMTDLRLDEVKGDTWETMSPGDRAERNSASWAKYREIINKWKEVNLTDWRKEHEASGKLIVTRAVCNEVAEHIQHMRGHEGAAGLTQKPNWYQREEREIDAEFPDWDGPRPFFKKARNVDDFKEGASILWLRYVRDFPNEWRIAHPLETIKEKDKLIPGGYLPRRGPGHWVYSEESAIPRKRDTNKDGRYNETQYLRWMHEATVVEVAETAEDKVVLTFETALPDEDRRFSTVGVFKRYPGDLLNDHGEDGYNPAFVGFVPEGEIPVAHLKDMLDWNKILLKEFKPPGELKAYQEKYIRSNVVRPEKKTTIFVSNDLREKKKLKMASIPQNTELWKTRNWGDEILVRQAGLSALFEFENGKKRGSNFNPLPLWTGSGVWSAIDNFLVIPRKDADNLIALQVAEGDATVEKKMKWLVYDAKYDRPYWCDGKGNWKTAPALLWGTIAFGGQLVLTDGDATFLTKLPEEKTERKVLMKRLVCFRRWDWDKTHETHPWLIQRATQVDHKDQFSDTPRGIIYSPLWSPLDWDFPGKYKPEAFYLPVDWLEPYKPEVGPPENSL